MKDGDVKILPSHTVRLASGREVTVKNIEVHMFKVDHGGRNGPQWEECWPSKSLQRIERAIERAEPGYYHKILKNGKHDKRSCPRCIQDRRKA